MRSWWFLIPTEREFGLNRQMTSCLYASTYGRRPDGVLSFLVVCHLVLDEAAKDSGDSPLRNEDCMARSL